MPDPTLTGVMSSGNTMSPSTLTGPMSAYATPGGTAGPNATPTFGGSPSNSSPQFSDIQKLLQPSNGISTETQGILDIINKQRDYYAGLGSSNAQALALQRGQAGSSTEQFGVQQAINQANLSAMGATSNILGQQMQNNLQQRLNLGQLTSDEIASLRNMGLSQQYLGLQKDLGQQGIGLGYANINAARDIASQQARNQLLSGGANLLFGPGGLGNPFNMFGQGGSNGPLGPMGGSFGGFGGGGGGGAPQWINTPQYQGWSNVPGAPGGGRAFAGAMSGGLFPNLAAGGLGMMAGNALVPGGSGPYGTLGGAAGGLGGSFFGPMGTAAGSAIGSAVGNWASQGPQNRWALATGGLSLAAPAIGKALGLSGGSGESSYQSGQIGGKQAGDVGTSELATTLGKPGQIAYDSNEAGSFERAYNKQLDRLTPDDLVKRYSTIHDSSMFNTTKDQQYKQTYDRLASQNNGQVDPSSFAFALGI